MSLRTGAFVFVAAVLLLGAGAAEASEVTEARKALDAKTAKALDEVAGWCTRKRLFGKRDETYALLLEYDPEHEKARKKLKYKKGGDGIWVQDPRFKRGTNWSKSAIPEFEKRLAAVFDAHRTELLALCEKVDTIADLLWARRELSAYARRHPGDARAGPLLRTTSLRYYRAARERGLVKEMAETATLLRSLYPQDIAVLSTLGETQQDGRWLLVESARTLGGGAKLGEIGKRTLSEMGKPAVAELTTVEAKIELPWQPGATAEDIRVVGTAKPAHLQRIAMYCQALGPIFEAALSTKPKRRDGLTLYVFAGKGELDTFLAGYPVVDNPSLRDRKKLGLDLVFVDGYGMALKANVPHGQLDICVNAVLNQMFSDTFLKSAPCRGWHAEGVSRYMGFKLLGTRYSVNVVGDYAGQGSDRKLPESEDDWLARAHGLLARVPQVGLPLMLGKGLDAFKERDAVLSYAFSAYLIEGYEGLAAMFVRTADKSADVDKACREILGMPVSVVEHRFRTWLEQVTKR